MTNPEPPCDVLTVTFNPALDQTVTIPRFAAGIVNRVEAVRTNPGGKGVNVAAALADYGHRVAVTGLLGRENPACFEELFAQKNITDRFVRIAGPTRTAIKISDPALHQTTDINYPGLAPASADLDALNRELQSCAAQWVVLAGSLPPGVDPAIYRRLIPELKARGCRVILDTSGEPLVHGVAAAPHVIKPNIHELETLLGIELQGENSVIEAARKLIAGGIEMVVVSMGRDGACFVTAQDALVAHPPEVEVRSTVGAGDAMVAGILAAQLRSLPLDECARLATAFSCHALARAADSSSTSIDSLLPQVQISQALP